MRDAESVGVRGRDQREIFGRINGTQPHAARCTRRAGTRTRQIQSPGRGRAPQTVRRYAFYWRSDTPPVLKKRVVAAGERPTQLSHPNEETHRMGDRLGGPPEACLRRPRGREDPHARSDRARESPGLGSRSETGPAEQETGKLESRTTRAFFRESPVMFRGHVYVRFDPKLMRSLLPDRGQPGERQDQAEERGNEAGAEESHICLAPTKAVA